MKLTKNMRSTLAEKICREWICKRHIKLKAPEVFVVWRNPKLHTNVSGWCWSNRRQITLHLPKGSDYREWIVLLAHEFSHYLDFWTSSPRWRKQNMPHGERFQRLMWSTLSKVHWERAASDHWIRGQSAHRPEFQNDAR